MRNQNGALRATQLATSNVVAAENASPGDGCAITRMIAEIVRVKHSHNVLKIRKSVRFQTLTRKTRLAAALADHAPRANSSAAKANASRRQTCVMAKLSVRTILVCGL